MDPISDEKLVELLPALAEAARANQQTAERFVPPRTGILEETAARRHQYVFGRRGVGKSTLLRKVESVGEETGTEVIFVDLETLRGRPYPDVLVELLIELLTALDRRLHPQKAWRIDQSFRRRGTRRELGRLIGAMRDLLDQPQVAQRTIRELRSQKAGGSAGADLELGGGAEGAKAQLKAGGHAEAAVEQETSSEARFEESKMDGLLSAAVLVRTALSGALDQLDETILIVLDDFYHVGYDDQPDVLSYLHQIAKNLDIYLKICGVRHRIQPFAEGDPPRGMQLGQDAGVVSLDITLEQFTAARAFLEEVLQGVCGPLGVEIDSLLTEGGRQRLVLGSGGVARDYLFLTQTALRHANERGANPTRPHNRIGAEDVNETAASLAAQKQEELAIDAGSETEDLRDRLSDIVKFCLDVNTSNVFLVESTKLLEETWGKEIQALADLRLVHQIGNLSVQTGSWRGRRFAGFILDLSAYTGTRSERIRQIEFWTAGGKQQTRRARLIYYPGASDQPSGSDDGTSGEERDDQLSGEWIQSDIFELLGEDS